MTADDVAFQFMPYQISIHIQCQIDILEGIIRDVVVQAVHSEVFCILVDGEQVVFLFVFAQGVIRAERVVFVRITGLEIQIYLIRRKRVLQVQFVQVGSFEFRVAHLQHFWNQQLRIIAEL